MIADLALSMISSVLALSVVIADLARSLISSDVILRTVLRVSLTLVSTVQASS